MRFCLEFQTNFLYESRLISFSGSPWQTNPSTRYLHPYDIAADLTLVDLPFN